MGIKERKIREREKLKKEILQAAKELFYSDGFQNVSMRNIAKKIEYSPTTIYNYFNDKNDLLTQIVNEYFNEFFELTKQLLEQKQKTPYQTLYQYLFMYINFAIENPEQYKFLSNIFNSPEKVSIGKTNASLVYKDILELVQLCLEKNIFKYNDENLITQSLWGILYGITMIQVIRPNFPWKDKQKLIELTLKVYLEGLQ